MANFIPSLSDLAGRPLKSSDSVDSAEPVAPADTTLAVSTPAEVNDASRFEATTAPPPMVIDFASLDGHFEASPGDVAEGSVRVGSTILTSDPGQALANKAEREAEDELEPADSRPLDVTQWLMNDPLNDSLIEARAHGGEVESEPPVDDVFEAPAVEEESAESIAVPESSDPAAEPPAELPPPPRDQISIVQQARLYADAMLDKLILDTPPTQAELAQDPDRAFMRVSLHLGDAAVEGWSALDAAQRAALVRQALSAQLMGPLSLAAFTAASQASFESFTSYCEAYGVDTQDWSSLSEEERAERVETAYLVSLSQHVDALLS
jgi:hypothetical protein